MTRSARLVAACAIEICAIAFASACREGSPGDADGGATFDAGGMDASEVDGSTFDGGVDSSVPDARASGDGGADAFSWGACSVDGVMGICIDVGACDAFFTGGGRSTPGRCPGPAGIQCCTPDDADAGARADGGGSTCDPGAMPLPNAGLVEEAGEGGCPAGMIAVTSALCVDRFEGSLVEVASDGTTSSWSPYFNPGTRRVRAVSLRGAVPQGYITGRQAEAACEDAGKRLCTSTEWLRGCQGSTGTTYPYGASRMPGVCNDARARHPAVEYFGTSDSWIWSELDHPCINQLPASLDRTGENAACVAESGALDMMGNLHEWVADAAGTFRGGFYVDTMLNGNGCLYATTAHDMGHWDYSTGFRCCADHP